MQDYRVRQISRRLYKSRNHKPTIVVILLLIFIFLIFLLGRMPNPTASKKNETLSIEKRLSLFKPKKQPSELLSGIKKLIDENQGTYSIYIYDLNKRQEIGINERMTTTAASVNKIAILAALYHLAEKKEIDLEKTITLQKEDIQDYGAGILRYERPGSIYSLKTLARLMMEKSDNTAGHIIANLIIGTDKIQSLINSWGLTQTNIFDNQTSVYDMGQLLIKMYDGQIASSPLKLEMLDFMDKSDFDDRIPAGLPEGISVYHKTGDEIGKIHDAGIVDPPEGNPYYLGIMTSDVTDEVKTKAVMRDISNKVYHHMRQL